MSEYHYNEQLGLVDADGNLTNEGKINRVLAVAGRFHIDRYQVEHALKMYDWDMEGALDYLAIMNVNLRDYMRKHKDQVQMTLYSAPSESAAKFYKDHEGAINAAGKVAEAGANIYPYLVMGAFIFLLACFGL